MMQRLCHEFLLLHSLKQPKANTPRMKGVMQDNLRLALGEDDDDSRREHHPCLADAT